jgi:hypothetical protein
MNVSLQKKFKSYGISKDKLIFVQRQYRYVLDDRELKYDKNRHLLFDVILWSNCWNWKNWKPNDLTQKKIPELFNQTRKIVGAYLS